MDTDERFTPRPIAAWFIIAAVASLLFMGFGVVSFFMHVFAGPNAMPLDQRAAYLAEPVWVKIAYGVAVFAGLGGAILLVMRRRLAEWALLVSLIAVLIWLAGLILVTPLRGEYVRERPAGRDRRHRADLDDLLVRTAFAAAGLAPLAQP
jgi:hypothetical protein